jgi:hypothetical protein
MAGLAERVDLRAGSSADRADRIISLLVPIATGYGAASPDDQALHTAVCAEVEGGTGW